MRHYFLILALSFIWCTTSLATATDSVKYVNASNFMLIGKGFEDTKSRYERLPANLEGRTRPPVWSRSKHCSGLAVRFHTDSPVIAAKWEVTENIDKSYFAATGFKGVDLYCIKNGTWIFVHSGIPSGKPSTDAILINNMDGSDREYMLYLPLYDGLSNLEIGVKSNAIIENPRINSPRRGKPVVFYGTSITQGGCVSRAGMAYPNQLSRMLDREIINLGFTGNGQLDVEIAEAMADIDASCFVIDCLPNVSLVQMDEKYATFLEIIREKKTTVPILMVENILYPHMALDQVVSASVKGKNSKLKDIYAAQKKRGDRNIYYMKADMLIGKDQEGTVEGVHPNDLGFYRMSQSLYPVIKKLIK